MIVEKTPTGSSVGKSSVRGSARRSVLIVEDEELISWSLAKALRNVGYETCVAVSVDGASDVLRATEIDILITDVKLSKGDGIDLAKAIRRVKPEMPIIVMTAGCEEHRLCRELHDIRYCEKPFVLEEMVRVVESLCGTPRSGTESAKTGT